ncbi:hypothetical protein TWF694_008431 [Orbilia ellipsospora]|uniref:Uncharacterized protein n=1 Tax=Orbilia ellipsospora TaxID=2528407 RepID=A0AAV9XMQ4_9PEZI
MAELEIFVINNSGQPKNYVFVASPPVVNGNPSDPGVFVSVWSSQLLDDGRFWGFFTSPDYYAWTGVSPGPLKHGITVRGGESLKASLGVASHPGTTFDLRVDGNPSLGVESAPTAPQGAFIVQSGDVPDPDLDILIGVGQRDMETGEVVPTSVMLAQPHTTTEFQPGVKFYVKNVDYHKHAILNVSSIIENSAVVDFTGKPANLNAAHVVHNADGTFTTTFVDNHKFTEVDVPAPSSLTNLPKQTIEEDPIEHDECAGDSEKVGDALTEGNSESPVLASTTAVAKIQWMPPGNIARVKADLQNISTRLARQGYKVTQDPIVTYPDGSITAEMEIQLSVPWAQFQRDWAGTVAPILVPENAKWTLIFR